MRLHQKSISKVTLLSVLKRRKSSLATFLQETGVVTYELLKSRCDSMGVIPPEEEEFLKASGIDSSTALRTVSSPTEGLIVLEPPAIVKEMSGEHEQIELESSNAEPDAVSEISEEAKSLQQDQDQLKKKKRKNQE